MMRIALAISLFTFTAAAQTYNTPSAPPIPSDAELIFVHGFHPTDLVWQLGSEWYVTKFGVTATPGAVVLRTIYMPEPAMERAKALLSAEINAKHQLEKLWRSNNWMNRANVTAMVAVPTASKMSTGILFVADAGTDGIAATRFRPVQPIPKLCTDMAALGESQSDINTSREWARSMGALMDCRGDLVRLSRADSQRRGVDPLQYFADHQLDFPRLTISDTFVVARDPAWKGYSVVSLLYDGQPWIGRVGDPECTQSCEVSFQHPLIAARPPVVVGWGK